MGEIKKFSFNGSVAASKSLYNRALIVQSFFPQLVVHGTSQADDVATLKKALQDLSQSTYYCGDGGTTFRFLLTRLSRKQRTFELHLSERLASRPHDDLFKSLETLGAQVIWGKDKVILTARGWGDAHCVEVESDKSSQYLSSLLLSAWGLAQDFKIVMKGTVASSSYFEMTLKILQQMGMELNVQEGQILIPKQQTLKVAEYQVEPDMSSCFAVAALALIGGEAFIQNFPLQSLQPDFAFVEMLKTLGGSLSIENNQLSVKQSLLKPGTFCLEQTPDLFPVLAVLLSGVPGISILSGLEVLKYKESNRVRKTAELLGLMGVKVEVSEQQFKIYGVPPVASTNAFSYDPDHDHRMAMAAGLAQQMGYAVGILSPEVVNKSFPEFWEILK